MASKEKFCWNDHADRCQLPTGLLIDPRVEQVKIWDNRAANCKDGFSIEIFLACESMFGLLLFGNQTSPTQMFFASVTIIDLRIAIRSQIDCIFGKRSDIERDSRTCSLDIGFSSRFRNRKGHVLPRQIQLQGLDSQIQGRWFHRCKINSMPRRDCQHLLLIGQGAHVCNSIIMATASPPPKHKEATPNDLPSRLQSMHQGDEHASTTASDRMS